ncbi:curli production assembly/transport protein CsgF [Billgrantia pellis]|uniref:Curli production assembly/transport component CsgF n=1 Tax=Billgrantia pellis TaxID=2606936 RepID=A0A7V7G0N1_9GAMM|nr:curli assembly protein CsgF [Halomonas pellis]KAA0010676.1 curli production assembly/transport protein CsgF [Halomonas pellis]
MNILYRVTALCLGALLTLAGMAQAGELIYRPINPSFGGDPLLGNHLLNKAQAQDTHKDPNAPDFGGFSEVDFFLQELRADLINRAIDDALKPNNPGGSESVIDNSSLNVRFVNVGRGAFQMVITDKTTNEVTRIDFGLPY